MGQPSVTAHHTVMDLICCPLSYPTGVVWHGAGTEMLAEEQRAPSENVVAIYATAVVPHKVLLSLAFWKYHFE